MLSFCVFSLVVGFLTPWRGEACASDCRGVLSDCPQGYQDPVCRGTLVITSPDNQEETFLYDTSDLICDPENLQEPLTFSSLEVEGCGKFSVHSGQNGRGNSILVRGNSGPLSAQGQQFTKIKSIKRRGCSNKIGDAPYIIIASISAVVLVVVGVGIFFKKRKIYSSISNNGDCEHVCKHSDEANK